MPCVARTLSAPYMRAARVASSLPLRRRRGDGACLCSASGNSQRSVLVVGGGAAGLTAAYFAASAGATVTVLERMSECGKKILMSGGTRANVLPREVNADDDFFSESNRSALRRLLHSWPLDDVRGWLSESLGVRLALEESTGKWWVARAASVDEACTRRKDAPVPAATLRTPALSTVLCCSARRFPAANSGREVRDALVAAARARGASVVHRASVEHLARSADGTRWEAHCACGAVHTADAVVLSTGGLSFPAVGTDGTGHRIAAGLGHAVHEPFPALVPLHGPHPGAEGPAGLAGVSLQSVALSAGAGKKAVRAHRGGFLFTHRGFSGPSVLDLSHRHVVAAMRQRIAAKQAPAARKSDDGMTAAPPSSSSPPPPLPLYADWTGEGRAAWEARLAAGGAALVTTRVAAAMPARLAAALCAHACVPPDRKAAELRKEERARLLDALTAFPLPITGDAGFAKAEVSGGGVALHELRLDTLESRKASGVFLCGELVDAFGRIGGFNFFLAWCTGRLAGLGAAGVSGAAARGEERAAGGV